ncbi:MAG: glycogen debranching protein GlgX, partial [Longimicrobiales bacterium]
GENDRDGENHNLSWNCGVEGPSEDPTVVALRERQKRNLLATLLLSQGVPMLRGGDELSHTQRGNNNAYCQDNEIGWLDWELDEPRRAQLEFTRRVIGLRARHPVLRRKRFYQGLRIRGSDVRDLTWLRPDGEQMTDEEWGAGWNRAMGVMLAGDALGEVDEDGNLVVDDTLLLLLNAHTEPVRFRLPAHNGGRWEVLIDTSRPDGIETREGYPPGAVVALRDRSLLLLCAARR